MSNHPTCTCGRPNGGPDGWIKVLGARWATDLQQDASGRWTCVECGKRYPFTEEGLTRLAKKAAAAWCRRAEGIGHPTDAIQAAVDQPIRSRDDLQPLRRAIYPVFVKYQSR